MPEAAMHCMCVEWRTDGASLISAGTGTYAAGPSWAAVTLTMDCVMSYVRKLSDAFFERSTGSRKKVKPQGR